MTQLFGVLNIGARALFAQQRAIDVTGKNIANVNTPGYSRERINMTPSAPIDSPIGPMGYGVETGAVERIYDRFLGVQITSENSNLGRWQARQSMLERVEVAFDESDGYGLSQSLGAFWNSWQDLALNPGGATERSAVAAAGQSLADTIAEKYDTLGRTQSDIDTAIGSAVNDINRLTSEIAELNRKIGTVEKSGQNANDYRDSRDLALKELSELIDISSFEDANGSVVVSVGNGRVLVEDTNQYVLETEPNAEGHTAVIWPGLASGRQDVSSEIAGGRVGGWLEARDTQIASYKVALNDLAAALIQEVNDQHALGFDLNGTAGGDFFTGSTAADIGMSEDILADGDLIAAASDAAAVPGDPTNALAMAGLRYELAVTVGGSSATFDGAVGSLVSRVGRDVQDATSNATHQADMMTYLENYRESVSGVSLDEEMVNLIKYQAAYTAAAKLISLADEMMDSLFTMLR
jgi:flagellar hook-associated protein 1 FlgK